MLVGTDLKKIKYVAIEVIRKGIAKAANVECGLFMGIVKKKDKSQVTRKFLALVVSDASVRLFNLDEYDVMTIDATDEESRYMTVFTKADDKDQDAAKLLLKEITAKLSTEKRLYPNDPNKEIIDIDTYEDYPDAVLKSDNLTADKVVNESTSSTSNTTGSTNNANYSSGTTYNNTTVKKDPVVTSIKRKGKLPLTEKMDSMKDKVQRLAEGTFELKALPILDCDKKEEDKKTTTVRAGYLT